MQDFETIAPGLHKAGVGKILGEIITWKIHGIAINHMDLVNSLVATGLESDVARELAPRNAFSRACNKLDSARIIRKVAEDHARITFQFTKETLMEGNFQYHFESLLYLNKYSGEITSDDPELESLARSEFAKCLASRTSNDVTKVVQRLFERHADLFSIRDAGGVYFVPQVHQEFVCKIETFVSKLGGSLQRFPVPSGSPQGDRAIQETVAHGLQSMIDDHIAAVNSFGEDTRTETLERASEKIRTTRFKIESYSQYLDKKREDLEASLQQASELLRTKLNLAMEFSPEDKALAMV